MFPEISKKLQDAIDNEYNRVLLRASAVDAALNAGNPAQAARAVDDALNAIDALHSRFRIVKNNIRNERVSTLKTWDNE